MGLRNFFYPAAKSKNNPAATSRFISPVTLAVWQGAADAVLRPAPARLTREAFLSSFSAAPNSINCRYNQRGESNLASLAAVAY